MIRFTIDGHTLETQPGRTILEAALAAGIYIPHLCYHPSLTHAAQCKLCVVEADGRIVCSCETAAEDGMTVISKNEHVDKLRRLSMELMLAAHPSECTACPKYLKCELQALTQYLGVNDSRMRKLPGNEYMTSENPLYIRDLSRCVLCGRCVRACNELRGADVLEFKRDGVKTEVAPKKGGGLLANGDCRFCGACVAVCPTGAIRDKDELFANFESEAQALVPCRTECPAGTDVPRYLALIRAGDYDGATAVIREKAPFPATLGYVCMRFCESACRRSQVNEAVSIRALKKYAEAQNNVDYTKLLKPASSTGKRVTVIGAGPAGLTAAYYLARKGHEADVYEQLPFAGGMLRVGIPAYRLPVDVVEREAAVIEAAGVKLHFNQRIENPAALLKDGCDAVIVAVGAHKGRRLPILGNDLPGVLTATEFLRSAALGEEIKLGRRVLILGGGNVAFDCAGTAKRMGAESVSVACLEPRDGMTASNEEIDEALKMGVEILNSRSFEAIDEGLIVSFCRVKQFAFVDSSLNVEKYPDSLHKLEADTVIFAAGQSPDLPEDYPLKRTRGGLLEADTGIAGVFAAGDAVSGTASVIQAIAMGREAAQAADRYLGGDGNIDESFTQPTERSPWLGHEENFAVKPRCTVSGKTSAKCEANRCLQCDLRLQIPKVKFWSEYSIR